MQLYGNDLNDKTERPYTPYKYIVQKYVVM